MSDCTNGIAALEEWCRRGVSDYPGVRVTNMTRSWRDGRAFCALIHRYRPDLIDFDKLEPRDWVGNCSLAFKVAEEELGIPALLEVEDVVRRPDRLSILTYLSQFYHALGRDSGLSSLSQSPASSDTEVESLVGSRGRRTSSVVGRRGAVLSLMADGRRARSASGPSRISRAPSPPIEQENPFIGMEVPPSNVVRRQTGRQVKGRRQMREVQSMYTTSPPSPVASPPGRRPRSMLAASSYARPYRPSTLQSAPSLLSLAYPRSRSQPPAKRRPLPLLQGLHESPPVMTQSCLGSLQQGCDSDKKEDVTSQVKEEKLREKVVIGDEEKENKIGGIFRRKGGSKTVGKSSILSRGLPKVKCQFFDRSLTNSNSNSTYQHLQASAIRLPPQFPFLQTLV